MTLAFTEAANTEADKNSKVSSTSRDGFVMPTAVIAIAAMSVIAIAVLSNASDEQRASRAVRESTLAVYTAEAGLRQTYGAWPSAPVKALNPGDSLDLGWQNLPNGGQYRAVIHRVDKGGLQEYNVIVQGRRTGLNGGISTVIGVVGGVPLFGRAIFGDTLVYLAGGSVIDGFDSEVGPYNPSTADSTADVFTNKNLYVQKATVKGDVAAGGTISLGTSGVNITGTQTAGAAVILPYDIIPCPSGGYTPATPELPGYTGNGALTLASNGVYNLTQSTYYFKSVVFAGQSTIKVPGNPHVTIYVQDSLYAAGGTFVNSGRNATALSIVACGTPTNPAKGNYWSISGGADAYFSIYAPNHVVYGVGNSDFYGAIISSLFYVSGGANVHYDAALARAESPKLAVQRATWGQFPGN